MRSKVAQEQGLTEEKVMALPDFETSALFDERDRAALRYARLFKQGEHAIDRDEVYDDLKKAFSEEEIIELGQLCAQTDGVGPEQRPAAKARKAVAVQPDDVDV